MELKNEADFEKYIGDRDASVVGEDFILDLSIAFPSALFLYLISW